MQEPRLSCNRWRRKQSLHGHVGWMGPSILCWPQYLFIYFYVVSLSFLSFPSCKAVFTCLLLLWHTVVLHLPNSLETLHVPQEKGKKPCTVRTSWMVKLLQVFHSLFSLLSLGTVRSRSLRNHMLPQSCHIQHIHFSELKYLICG